MPHPIWVCIVGFCFFLTLNGNPLVSKSADPYQLIQEWEEKKPNTSKCEQCLAGFELLDLLLKLPPAEDLIVELAVKICLRLELTNVDEIVCRGAVIEFKDEVIYTITHSVLDGPTACGMLRVCKPVDRPKTWTIPIPEGKPPVFEVPNPPANAKTYKVLHITDTHWDPNYEENLEATCGQPLCCREKRNDTQFPAWKWGTYADCDIPLRTVEKIYEDAAKYEFDYIIWTGDLPAHNVWSQSQADQRRALSKMVETVAAKFPNIRVFPTVGNHESAPVNSFPPDYVPDKFKMNWLYDNMAANWSIWINDTESQNNIKHMGSYDVAVDENLHIISINTNYGNDQNYWLLINDTDPQGMLTWLTGRLLLAESQNIKVHIIAHIQPSSCLDSFRMNLENILYRFESTVVAQFYGHSHSDEFAVYYEAGDSRKRAVGVALIPGSMTTYSNKNPQYRIYTIDGNRPNSTYAVLDYVNYYLDLEKSKSLDEPLFYKEFTAKEAYGLTSLNPQDWSDLIVRMAHNLTLFDLYYKFQTGSAPQGICDDNCWFNTLCGMRSDTTKNPSKCDDLKQIIDPPTTRPTSSTATKTIPIITTAAATATTTVVAKSTNTAAADSTATTTTVAKSTDTAAADSTVVFSTTSGGTSVRLCHLFYGFFGLCLWLSHQFFGF